MLLLSVYVLRANIVIQSVKLIGLFVTALVGLYTIEDLWNKFGDLRMPVVRKSRARPWAVLKSQIHSKNNSATGAHGSPVS